MKNITLGLMGALMSLLAMTSCSKSEGKGGNSKICGYVYTITDDGDIKQNADQTFSFVRDTTPAIDKNVFIVYGDGYAYDDKTGTNGYGYFEFDYLREGDYQLYAISDNNIGKSPVFESTSIGKKETVTVNPIYVYDGKNTKKCGVVGKMEAMYSKADEYTPAVGLRVYIRKSDGSAENDTRTDDNGIFKFAKLDAFSTYVVYAESETEGKNYGVFAESMQFTTGAAGEITNLTTLPIKVKIY